MRIKPAGNAIAVYCALRAFADAGVNDPIPYATAEKV